MPVALVAFEAHADATEDLLRAYHETVAERFGAWLAAHDAAAGFDAAGELATDRAALGPPDPAPLALAWNGDRAVGCVYLYERTPDVAEGKRLYVRESARGRGLRDPPPRHGAVHGPRATALPRPRLRALRRRRPRDRRAGAAPRRDSLPAATARRRRVTRAVPPDTPRHTRQPVS